MLWPSLRGALDGLEAQARGSAFAVLRGIPGRVSASLRPEVEHALATRWTVCLPRQQPLPASAENT
jgi:hypothetical protein